MAICRVHVPRKKNNLLTGELSVTHTEIELYYGWDFTVKASTTHDAVTAVSANTSVCDVTVNGFNITITNQRNFGEGGYNGVTTEVAVSVVPKDGFTTPDPVIIKVVADNYYSPWD